jgi:hypothetical protein
MTVTDAAALTPQDLLQMSTADLDALFTASPPGPIPEGEADGEAIIAPGTPYSPEIAGLINQFAWQGKVFHPETGDLRNRILPTGWNAIVAKVYDGASWFDQNPCIVIDYSQTSLIAHWIRDEIRLIAPGLYLGKVYLQQTPVFHFSLKV